jgi:hypothetical protein
MPFTAQELENISNAALDFHMRGAIHKQSIQDKPLLRAMKAAQKFFPGGKEKITKRAKGDYTTTIQGYTHDDVVTYANPANIKQAEYSWKEIHAGIQVTMTELKTDGISVVDTAHGAETSQHSRREMTALANLLEDKLEDMSEGYSRGMNEMFLRDGTADAKQTPGVRSIVLDDPTSATVVGGIDQQANTWWRNRASLTLSTTTPSKLVIINKLDQEIRQLRRFGGRPKLALCGNSFLEALEKEVRSKGTFTDRGWDREKNIEIGMADLALKGVQFVYDPTLDDESLEKYCYMLDTRHIHPSVMTGEEDKTHSPARPEDQYVIHRAITWTGGFVCWQRNSQGVYSIA